jgi:hypothetical protein
MITQTADLMHSGTQFANNKPPRVACLVMIGGAAGRSKQNLAAIFLALY